MQAQALWWSLALGADFGGNLTAVGASANVVVLGIADRNGTPSRSGSSPRRASSSPPSPIAVAAPYMWLRYFAFA